MGQKNALETGKSNTRLECKSQKSSTNKFRYASSFGDCSEKCGPGKMSRRVFCIKVLPIYLLIDFLRNASKDGSPVAPTDCPEDLKPLEEDDCDNNCTISDDGSGDNATEVRKTKKYAILTKETKVHRC